MAYLGEYTEVGWQNEPSRATPVNAHNLGIMEDGIKRLFYYLLAGGGTGGGSAADGREVELRNNGEYIQWRYSGDEEWINLVSLSDLKGEKGDDYVLTEEDILKIAEKVKIDAPDSASDISFENEGTNLESTDVQGAIGELSGQIPHNTSELTNDSDYQTGEQVRAEIGKMTHYKFEKADSLEDVTEENVIYLIPNEESKEDNIFDEYLLVDGVPELIGSTAIDLSGYALKEEIPTVPEKLPNPNPLTFTGAVTGSYDGSEAISIDIPISSGGGGFGNYTILKNESIVTDESGLSEVHYKDVDLSQYSEIIIFIDRTKDDRNTSNTDLKVNAYTLGYILCQNLSLANPKDSYRDAIFEITNFGNKTVLSRYTVSNNHKNNPSALQVGSFGSLLDNYLVSYDNGIIFSFNFAYIGTLRICILAK